METFRFIVFRRQKSAICKINTGLVHTQGTLTSDHGLTVFTESPLKPQNKVGCACKQGQDEKCKGHALGKDKCFLADQQPTETNGHARNLQYKLDAAFPHFACCAVSFL